MESKESEESKEGQGLRAAEGYAGDVTPILAYTWWQSEDALLVDVRTDAEREWVGFIPDTLHVRWKQWPGMELNANFDADLLAAVVKEKKVLFICRSGIRSAAAARRATELGLEAYNVLEGFEGDLDAQSHRGTLGGWRMRDLPWQQG